MCIKYTSCCNHEGKRSLEEVGEFNTQELESLDAANPVEPFNMEERIRHIHKRSNPQLSCQGPDSDRYILFIVDASGSIGRHFEKVQRMLANISEKFCGNIHVAMITYTSVINLEFCFNCYTNRSDIADAILRARTVGGWTHTTDATKCACETLFTEECGLPNGQHTYNIDVVYLTDGRHNGPCRSRLTDEIRCLHLPCNINTYAIAVGDAALETVEALQDKRTLGHVLDVKTFADLEFVFEHVMALLTPEDSSQIPLITCISHNL